MTKHLTIWTMTTGAAGMVSQVRGLAASLVRHYEKDGQMEVKICEKTIGLRAPWSFLPGHLCPFAFKGLTANSSCVVSPWPDILITSGRRSAAIAIAIKRASKGHTKTIHLQRPYTPTHYFDAVIAPLHDQLTGDNVFTHIGALHHLTDAKLAEGAKEFASTYKDLPRPLIGVIIGGATKHYRMSQSWQQKTSKELLALQQRINGSLLVTTSRRTPADVVASFTSFFSKQGNVMLYTGEGKNPYLGLLALSDTLIVSEDSVSMLSEACFTGKPVYVLALEGKSPRHRAFHQTLYARGLARPFEGKCEHWEYEQLDETAAMTERLMMLLPR